MSNEAPERIWAFAPNIFDGMSFWQDAPSPAGDTVQYVHLDLLTAAEARAEAAEAKLAKAVKALETLNVGEGWAAQIARATLAEITGETDDHHTD